MSIVAKIILLFLTFTLLGVAAAKTIPGVIPRTITTNISTQQTPSPTAQPIPTISAPNSYTIPLKSHVIQSFNNCGPASLSMALSYYDINVSQEIIGKKLRPWQNPQGINDDKSVFVPELAKEAESYGVISFNRPNGDMELIKRAVSQNLPVLVRTWLHPNEDIGHYRLVRGYNDTTRQIIQDDSYEGKNLIYSYDEFLRMWQPFNYEYLLLIPREKEYLAERIIGADTTELTAWQNANSRAKKELETDPSSIYAQFNLSRSYFYLKDYTLAVNSFEAVEKSLPSRMLWYQTEPIEAYLMIGNYDRVYSMTERILQNNNLAYSELYLLRGKAYLQQERPDLALTEFEKAVRYNENFEPAKAALTSI